MDLKKRLAQLERLARRKVADDQRPRWLVVELPDDAGGVEAEVYDLRTRAGWPVRVEQLEADHDPGQEN